MIGSLIAAGLTMTHMSTDDGKISKITVTIFRLGFS